MKLTKQRLKEIIKEEVASIRESDIDDWGYMPPREPGSWPRPRDMQTEPRFDADRSPEQKLIDALAQRAAVDGMSAEDAAAAYGLEGDADVIAYIQGLLGDKMLDNPRGVGEGKVSSHRSEVTYSKEKRGKSKRPEKKAYNKAVRAQSKRDIKKGED